MTVLQLSSHLDIVGITLYVLSVSQRLVQRGHRVMIGSDHGHREADVAAMGALHWPLPLHTSSEISLQVFRAWRMLADRLREEPVDVIHAHTRVAQVIAQRMARQFGIPYVTTWHGIFKRRLGRRLWPCTGDVTIAISEPVRQHLIDEFHVADDRVRCIYNGVDSAYYAATPDASVVRAYRERWNIPAQHPVIGGIGRMAAGRVKGFDLILLAATVLKRLIPGVHVLLVGDGPRRPFLEDVAERLGIRDRVHFAGATEDVRVPLALIDVFIFSSRWPEGFGLSLIEAMAAARPVVAVRSGAVPDIVEHERSGLIVPPEDPIALAEAAAQILRDPAYAARLTAHAQARVRERFSLERMVDQIEAVYREVARGEGRKMKGPHTPHLTPHQRTIMRRILVVLPNWYGETLFATPFLRALRQQQPDAFIATLGWPQCREVLLSNPHLNELIDYDERGIHRSPFAKWRLIHALHRRRFDTAFILRRSLSRSLMLALAGVPTQIGFENPHLSQPMSRHSD